jgi:hypothetical protein
MKTTIALLSLGLSATINTASADCIKGVGEVVKKSLSVDAFHGIRLEGSMNVVLTQGATQAVEVEAQANLIELIETKVVNGVWEITTKDGYSTDKTFTVHITAPVIDKVYLDGSGDITSNGTFTADAMDLALAGSGNITIAFNSKKADAGIAGSGDMVLSGTCDKLDVDVAGSGDVDARELKVADATVDIAGSGDVVLDASQSLEADIAGSGDVSYRGAPARISRNVMGSGEVRSLERGPR